jgi:hypothetical protein
MSVSHEAIHLTLFVQARGALKRELATHLRTLSAETPVAGAHLPRAWLGGRSWTRSRSGSDRRGGGPGGPGALKRRPADRVRPVADCPAPEGRSAEHVVQCCGEPRPDTSAVQLRRSLTWDCGLELPDHNRFTVDTGVQVYLCDPEIRGSSSRQRGTNENTNGLLRQYFPKGTDLPTQRQRFRRHPATLNGGPRKTLVWKTPARPSNEHLQSRAGVATPLNLSGTHHPLHRASVRGRRRRLGRAARARQLNIAWRRRSTACQSRAEQ